MVEPLRSQCRDGSSANLRNGRVEGGEFTGRREDGKWEEIVLHCTHAAL